MENYIPTNDSSEMLDTIDRFRSNYSLIGEGVVDKIIDELADVGLYMHDDYDIEDILYYLNNQWGRLWNIIMRNISRHTIL